MLVRGKEVLKKIPGIYRFLAPNSAQKLDTDFAIFAIFATGRGAAANDRQTWNPAYQSVRWDTGMGNMRLIPMLSRIPGRNWA